MFMYIYIYLYCVMWFMCLCVVYMCMCCLCVSLCYVFYTASRESREAGKLDGQNGGWQRSRVEAPRCETLTRLCEKPSCASSTLSHLTHLGKLAPHFTHIGPSPISYIFVCAPIGVCLCDRSGGMGRKGITQTYV